MNLNRAPCHLGFPGDSMIKESTWNAGDTGLIPGSGRFRGEGNGYPLQCSCLGNAWTGQPHGLQTRLSNYTTTATASLISRHVLFTRCSSNSMWKGRSHFSRDKDIVICIPFWHWKPLCQVHFSSVTQSCSTLCDPMNFSMPPCPSPTPEAYSNPCPSNQWCHPAISSSVIPFSSCPQSLLASESFPMSQLFAWSGQSIGVSALASFLPKKSQGWSPSEWTGWISLQSKGLSRVLSNTTVQKYQFFSSQLSSQSNSHIHRWLLEKA